MKRLLCMLAFLPALSFAQRPVYEQRILTTYSLGTPNETKSDYKPFRHMQVGLTGGTTGVGFELGTNLCKSVKMRAGFSYFPKMSLKSSYSMSSVSDIQTNEEQEKRIERLCNRLGEFINSDNIDPYVEMDHRANFWNAKILFDVYPFHKKNWHFTLGAYLGPKKMGTAINMQHEAPTMMAVNIYNGIYQQLKDDLTAYHEMYPDDEDYIPSVSFMGFDFSPLPDQWEEMQKLGRVVIPMGQFADGQYHYLEPNENGVMHAKATTHVVKPYIGFGYDFSFGMQKRWNFAVDAGTLIFGKAPHVRDNTGVCLTHDVHGIGGEVGDLIHVIKKLPVYPNFELRLSYTIY